MGDRGLLRRAKTSFGMLNLMCRSCCVRPVLPPRSAFAGFRFPREVIARCFFARALATTKVVPVEVTTDKAAVYPHVLMRWPRVPGTARSSTPTTEWKQITAS
jgi:hypothetical protein